VYSDADGRFVLPSKSGFRDILVTNELYTSVTVENIRVAKGETTRCDISLTPSGEWPMFGGSMKHTRNTPIQANILRPKVRWKYPLKPVNPAIGAIDDIDGDGSDEILLIAGEKVHAYDGNGSLLWRTEEGIGNEIGTIIGIVDLDNNSVIDIVCGNRLQEGSFGQNRLARLAIVNGMDGTVQYEYDFFDSSIGHCEATGYGSANNLHADNTIIVNVDEDPELEIVVFPFFAYEFTVLDFSDGVERGIAAYIVDHPLWGGEGVAIGNIDGDGTDEIVTSWKGKMIIYNAEDCSLQYGPCEFAVGNTRGSTVLRDVDHDGLDEIVQIAAWSRYAPYITVFDADLTGMTIKWQRTFDNLLCLTHGTVDDVDGDGMVEIVVGVNEGDMHVINAEDGSTEWSVPNKYPKAVKDMDGDGIPEIFASNSPTAEGAAFIYIGNNNTYIKKCSFPEESWVCGPYPLEYPPAENHHCADHNPPNVEYLNQNIILMSDGLLRAYDVTEEIPAEQWSYTCPSGRNIAIGIGDTDGDSLDNTVVVVDDGTMRILDEHGEEEVSVILDFGSIYLPKVADINFDGKNEIIVQVYTEAVNQPAYYAGDMMILDASNATPDIPPEEVEWGYDGVYYDCPGRQFYSPLYEDIDGDGFKEVLIDRTEIDFSVLNWDGTVKWEVQYRNSLMGTGYFNSDSVKDVFLTDYSSHHFYCLDGENGTLLWDESKPSQGIPAVADVNADGIDDLLAIQEGNHVLAYDGKDGTTLWDNHETCALCFGGTLAIGDTDGDGIDEIITTGNFGIANYELNGDLIWQQRDINSDAFKTHFGSLVDVNEDGAFDLVQPCSHGLHVLDGRDGTELWHFYPEPKVAVTSTIAADMDSDGSEEILFGANDGYLYALNKEDGSPLWKYRFGWQVGTPVVADVDNDGKGEILIASNGYLYCLDDIRIHKALKHR
jgi:outer membrane protein assembly factor BamB